ncbi:hypothetical protein BD311DRAFT_770364 [Dichomitus squalens]|uniref:Uncharacterized protein n=1 Tax=Dichomitus squalens TaxID=114155 RepID=A0A4Q9M649_9APHY|nr:hypothetical protein BD311DRAFT_770364 [Dichomitus squalens]
MRLARVECGCGRYPTYSALIRVYSRNCVHTAGAGSGRWAEYVLAWFHTDSLSASASYGLLMFTVTTFTISLHFLQIHVSLHRSI